MTLNYSPLYWSDKIVRHTRLSRLAAATFVALLAVTGNGFAAIHRVDQNARASGDGTSWGSAYNYLQSALAVANSGDEIWIARGNYYPDQTSGSDTNSVNATFTLISGVEIYGGFLGTETQRSQRAPRAYRTVLNGQVANSGKAENVVTGTSADVTALLDGCTIANGERGLICDAGGAPVIVGCRFVENSGGSNNGGGVWNDGALTLRGCSFLGNTAFWGAGLYSTSSGITVENCTFLGNRSGERGYGVASRNANITLTGCSFQGNRGSGGGTVWIFNGTATLSHCVLWGNLGGSFTDDSVRGDAGGAANYDYCLSEHVDLTGSGTGNFDGTDPLNDPLFISPVDPFDAPESEGNLGLQLGSLLLEAGVNASALGAYDADGRPRIADGNLDGVATLDIGAHERPQLVYVDFAASGGNDGTSWSDAFTTLQDALAISVSPLEIWVAGGSYFPDEGGSASANDRAASFTINDGQIL
jgi:hypothetical protein